MLKLLERPKPFFLFENSLLHVRCLLLPTNAHGFANIHFCDRWMFKRHFCLDGMVATSKEHPALILSFRYDFYFLFFLFFCKMKCFPFCADVYLRCDAKGLISMIWHTSTSPMSRKLDKTADLLFPIHYHDVTTVVFLAQPVRKLYCNMALWPSSGTTKRSLINCLESKLCWFFTSN